MRETKSSSDESFLDKLLKIWARGLSDLETLFFRGMPAHSPIAIAVVTFGYALLLSLALSIISPASAQPLGFFSRTLLLFLHVISGLGGMLLTALVCMSFKAKLPLRLVLIFLTSPLFVAPVSYSVDQALGVVEEDSSGSGMFVQLLSECLEVAPTGFILISLTLSLLWLSRRLSGSIPSEAFVLTDKFPDAPVSIGDDVVRASAEGHHVELETTLGTGLVHCSIAEAIDRLTDLKGWQVHRSHWVRANKVKSLEKSGSAYVCHLVSGTQVPVSRRRFSEIGKQIKAETRSNIKVPSSADGA